LPPEFYSDSFLDYARYGIRSLILGLYLLGSDLSRGAPVVFLVLLVTLPSKRVRGYLRQKGKAIGARARNRLSSTSAETLAGSFFLLAVLSVSAVTLAYRDLLIVMTTMEDPTAPVANLAILSPQCEAHHVAYSHDFARVILVLVAVWLFLFSNLKRRGGLRGLATACHAASALVIITALIFLCLPWPILWNNEFEPVHVGEEKGYIIAQRESELFVYFPMSQGRRQAVLRAGAPGVDRYAEGTLEILFNDFEPEHCP